MLKVKEAIVVEGRYDKNTLSQLVDTLILTTEGFQIFQKEDKRALLRAVAQRRGLIVLTDSDAAGFLIRNHLRGILPQEQVKHCYIPDVYGKERRKRHPGKEGKLGVEGMSPAVLEEALRRCGATILGETEQMQRSGGEITKLDLYRAGLSGGEGSAQRRKAFLRAQNLPEHLSANALVQVLNTLMTREEFEQAVLLSAEPDGGEKP